MPVTFNANVSLWKAREHNKGRALFWRGFSKCWDAKMVNDDSMESSLHIEGCFKKHDNRNLEKWKFLLMMEWTAAYETALGVKILSVTHYCRVFQKACHTLGGTRNKWSQPMKYSKRRCYFYSPGTQARGKVEELKDRRSEQGTIIFSLWTLGGLMEISRKYETVHRN